MRVTDEMVDAYWDAFIRSTGTALEDIRAGLEAALAAMPQVEGLETTEAERAAYAKAADSDDALIWPEAHFVGRCLRDIDRLAARLAAAEVEKEASYPAEAVIEGPNIVIRVPISVIPVAFDGWPNAPRNEDGDPIYRVTDAATFAKGIVRYLNNESEDGTTRIHLMLDSAMNEALEQGEEGVDEIAALAAMPDADALPEPSHEERDAQIESWWAARAALSPKEGGET